MSIYAFIDSQNLKKSVDAIDRKIDYKRFRLWLNRKYGVEHAIMYFGYLNSQQPLYNYLKKCGFELKFREVDYHLGKAKANVDIFLTISAMDLMDDIDKAYLVTSDGDFFDLAERFKKLNKFGGVISPRKKERCSTLLKKCSAGRITFIPNVIHKFEDRT